MSSDNLRNGVFSFIIPGLGQGLNGDIPKAAVLFVIMIILHGSTYFLLNNAFGSIISTAFHAYAGIDAYMTASDK